MVYIYICGLPCTCSDIGLLNPPSLVVFGVSNCTVARYLLIFHMKL